MLVLRLCTVGSIVGKIKDKIEKVTQEAIMTQQNMTFNSHKLEMNKHSEGIKMTFTWNKTGYSTGNLNVVLFLYSKIL